MLRVPVCANDDLRVIAAVRDVEDPDDLDGVVEFPRSIEGVRMALLFRGYARTGARLLFWSGLCFVGLSVNNVLLFFDFVVFPTQVDLRPCG